VTDIPLQFHSCYLRFLSCIVREAVFNDTLLFYTSDNVRFVIRGSRITMYLHARALACPSMRRRRLV
jgi:hypothetical protein